MLVNPCSSDSGVVCQKGVDTWPVNKSQASVIKKTVNVCTICMWKVHEVTISVVFINQKCQEL